MEQRRRLPPLNALRAFEAAARHLNFSRAADELRAIGIPVIALNMVGSITDHVDLVVSDPVQAGTMAVMAIADTATFDLTATEAPAPGGGGAEATTRSERSASDSCNCVSYCDFRSASSRHVCATGSSSSSGWHASP